MKGLPRTTNAEQGRHEVRDSAQASKPSVSEWREGGRLFGGRKHAKTYAFVSETTFPASACKVFVPGEGGPFSRLSRIHPEW